MNEQRVATRLEPVLGPFYECHSDEVIPVGYEEVMAPLAAVMGEYTVTSYEEDARPRGSRLLISPYDMTKFIQEDWDRVMAGGSPRSFLMGTHAARYATGRLAEEVILKNLLRGVVTSVGTVTEVINFWEASDQGLVQRVAGVGSDDLVLLLDHKRLGLAEAKASFAKKPTYLRSSRSKITRQLRASLEINRDIGLAVAALVDLVRRVVVLAANDRESFLRDGLRWPV